ncbi:tetraacyldisaccharide 4'-kinase [Polynucleobacter sphagniphilus]|uniref:tetraacyldisaccharide 4'-kinase n=1 Tax=Polynucleobacter sphagniphilus TaxID=1743169 RepID=UPI0024740067|nr:tetraacyldisaccharide 4'-kinase [Polynucleobacter sphagniphilus]MDH6420947.1 tetraacyldisaccharide 4'-kinase [Polynucleobacter sphagniphilus]
MLFSKKPTSAIKHTAFFNRAPRFWERRGPIGLLLWPLSWLYGLGLRARQLISDLELGQKKGLPVPIIIVGNIRVGGTGKTPIVIALATQLARLGWKPGIISRGYGAQSLSSPMQVTRESDPAMVGDEPVLIAKKTDGQFPMWVFPKRKAAIEALLKQFPATNVIISDDGLQHAGLKRWPAREGGRDIELVVRDARGEGNRFLLPAGPLREPSTRDRDATLMIGMSANNASRHNLNDEYFMGRRAFNLSARLGQPYQLIHSTHTNSLAEIAQASLQHNVLAVAAIGNPQRFFDDLQKEGIALKGIALADHATYTAPFFENLAAQYILITEKDAVKCAGIQDERIWVVPQNLALPEAFIEWVTSILHRPDPQGYTL